MTGKIGSSLLTLVPTYPRHVDYSQLEGYLWLVCVGWHPFAGSGAGFAAGCVIDHIPVNNWPLVGNVAGNLQLAAGSSLYGSLVNHIGLNSLNCAHFLSLHGYIRDEPDLSSIGISIPSIGPWIGRISWAHTLCCGA